MKAAGSSETLMNARLQSFISQMTVILSQGCENFESKSVFSSLFYA